MEDNMSNKEELERKVAWLESRLDQAESELSHLNQLLVTCGFSEGVRTLKLTIEDLLDETGNIYLFPPNEENPPRTIDPFG